MPQNTHNELLGYFISHPKTKCSCFSQPRDHILEYKIHIPVFYIVEDGHMVVYYT